MDQSRRWRGGCRAHNSNPCRNTWGYRMKPMERFLTGTGVELGAGIGYADPSRGLNEECRRAALPRALSRCLVPPVVPPGSRAAVLGLSPQVRGGRCRSSAARAKLPVAKRISCPECLSSQEAG